MTLILRGGRIFFRVKLLQQYLISRSLEIKVRKKVAGRYLYQETKEK